MQGLDQILASNGTDLGSLGARFGLNADQTNAALTSLLPAVLGGFRKKAETGALGGLETTVAGVDEPEPSIGNDILGHIFGSKDVSRQVADSAAGQSGVSSTILKAMLPIVAAMVAKHFAGNAGDGSSGGLGGMLGSILGGGEGGLGGLGGLLGAQSGTNPLDQILARFR
ncbi:MAG: DUF937 domain-containing protein [Sphingomonas sp.]|uniref:DUF937 domain-containing protein n=1 Tax=Sphingomonas sp. TaxID=28214 RepID=UPI001AC5BD1B|nr:DUF937 domain-containing protein [Sphingomonas sp.]MBN8808272.1 DUF937 domain-containing protein [Sphingomonas sp.]